MNKWKESLSILTIGISFLTIIFFINPQDDKSEDYITQIPKTTSEHYLLNTSDLFKKIIFNELFVHKDEVVIGEIKELLSKETKTKASFSDLSIDFFSPLEIIRFKKNNTLYAALKFKISNTITFDQNQKYITTELLFRDKLVGFWIFGASKNETSSFRKFITSNLFTYKAINDKSKQFVSVFKNSKLESISSIELNENMLMIKKKQKKRSELHSCLKPNGFHVSSFINTDKLSNFKNNRILELIQWNHLNYFSLNYRGLNFLDDDELPAFPNFEIYLVYKNSISGESMISDLIKQYNIPFKNNGKNYFVHGDKMIIVKQIDTNQFIIGTSSSDFQLAKTRLSPNLSGDPKNIIKVANAGWKSLFLELIPSFKASKNLLETTQGISTYRNKNGSQVIFLSFKKKEDALHSLLKFTLNFQ
jgi:hypothetical protein